MNAKTKLFEAHPSTDDLKIDALTLRYIDAVELDYLKLDVLDFLHQKMGVTASLPDNLFEDTGVDRTPQHLVWQSIFRCNEPAGAVHIRFATGQKKGNPALVWETTVQSMQSDVPDLPDGFEGWIDAVHKITGDWFFKLIDGELKEQFA